MPIFLILLLFPFTEVALLVMLADRFSGTAVLLYLLASALLGIVMLRNQRIGALLTLGSLLGQRENTSLYSLLWPLRYTLAGVLFIIPGVLSEIAGILLLLPLKGPRFAQAAPMRDATTPPPHGADIIEGEYHRVDDERNKLH